MDSFRLLRCLDAEMARLRAAAARDLTAQVPTCPEWTVEDLIRHVADFYLNVVVRRLHMPGDVPMVELPPDAFVALDHGYNAAVQELAGRHPEEHVGQMPHETVYYWTRRATHETAIHRVDVELAVADPIVPMPRDLAIDGIDEMLTGFLSELTRLFPEEFAADLSDWNGNGVAVSTGDAAWWITIRPDRADVTRVDPGQTFGRAARARIHGDPARLVYWLYNRANNDQVTTTGDHQLVAQLKRLLTAVTNTA
jgi:uncharacterized protein (TIGR03083 family)